MGSSQFYVVLQSIVLSAILFAVPAFAASTVAATAEVSVRSDARVAERIEAAWRVQRRWEGIAKNGSFEYEFDLKTWNSANRLKEHLQRTARVESRDGISRTEVLAAKKDDRDDLEAARKEQRELEMKKDDPDRKRDGFPSPFDPKYREGYVFSEAAPGEGSLSFHPSRRMDGAIAGTAQFDAQGRPSGVWFTLAHPPIFTRNLKFTIALDEDGNPVSVESSGEVSLVIWKRRFESSLIIRNVVPAAAEKEKP